MSKILVNCNLQTGEWTVRDEVESSFYADLNFYFSDVNSPVMFKNLSFGFSLKKNGQEMISKAFPTNLVYVASENTFFDHYLETFRLFMESDTSFILDVWCENDGIRREHSFGFITPPEIPVVVDPAPEVVPEFVPTLA
jgi:hypothetical protein